VIRLPAADNDSLFIIQNSTPAAVAFIGGGGQVGFTPGPVLIGTVDSVRGQIQLYSEGAASTQGGLLLFHLAADHDTTFASWNLDASEDDLRIYSSDAASIHYFRAGGNVELAADLSLATGQGIIHADGVTLNYILQADGTRYVPVDPAGVLPVAPSARGHILRAEVGPVWASYNAATLGAVLIGDGTDVISDTTPTLVGDLTMDDGTGDSPAVNFVGGTNNDTAKVYLADNATVTDSDLIIQLCDTAGDSVLGIHDSTPAAVLEIDSNGNVELQNDGTWIGRGAGSARIEFNAAGNAVKLYSGADLEMYSDAGSTKVGTWDGATGNITLVDDAWIGLGAASTRMIFDSTSGNSLDLYSAADLRLFSDAGTTQVGLWDGATGDILLDDGSGDSPAVQFIGGTNNDTIKIFLDDWAVAGGSDLNVQLADAAGESNFEIWDSTPAAVLKIDSDGNVELINDGAWVGFVSAGPKLTFDNANDYLEISDCSVGIGTTAPGGILHCYVSLDSNQSSKMENANSGSSALAAWTATSDSADVSLIAYSSGQGQTNLQDYGAVAAESTATGLALIAVAAAGEIDFYAGGISTSERHMTIEASGDIGFGTNNPGSLTEWNFATENLEFVDAGSAGATEQDWIQVQVGGNTGYIRVFASV
jgi:hypothetical protein